MRYSGSQFADLVRTDEKCEISSIIPTHDKHSDLHIVFDNMFFRVVLFWSTSSRAVPMRGALQFGPADDDPRIS